MKEAFPGFTERRAPDRPKLTVQENLEMRALRIDKRAAIQQLEAEQERARPRRLKEEEEKLREIKPTDPVYKPDGARTGRADPVKQAALNVAAREMRGLQLIERHFRQREAAILDKARAREETTSYDPAKDIPTGDQALQPQEVTPAYIAAIERMTHEADLPLSHPDLPESDYPFNWPGGEEQGRGGGGREGDD